MKQSRAYLAPVGAAALREINQVSFGFSHGACHRRMAQMDTETETSTAERRLVAAVLIRAAKDVADVGMHDARYEDIIDEVIAWANDDKRTPGDSFWSFGDVCEILGIDPDVVRPKLVSGELGRMFENGRCLGGGSGGYRY